MKRRRKKPHPTRPMVLDRVEIHRNKRGYKQIYLFDGWQWRPFAVLN